MESEMVETETEEVAIGKLETGHDEDLISLEMKSF